MTSSTTEVVDQFISTFMWERYCTKPAVVFIINYLDFGVCSNISKFAEDTKIGKEISSEQEAIILEGESNCMHECVVKWQMDFNIIKCSTIHVSIHNTRNRYTQNGAGRKIKLEERLRCVGRSEPGLRVVCRSARNRTNRVLGFIARSVFNRSIDVIPRFYLALVRPHLNYAV